MPLCRLCARSLHLRLQNNSPVALAFFILLGEQLIQEFQDEVSILKINVDENVGLVQKYGILSIPSLLLIVEGEEVARRTGVTTLAIMCGLVLDAQTDLRKK